MCLCQCGKKPVCSGVQSAPCPLISAKCTGAVCLPACCATRTWVEQKQGLSVEHDWDPCLCEVISCFGHWEKRIRCFSLSLWWFFWNYVVGWTVCSVSLSLGLRCYEFGSDEWLTSLCRRGRPIPQTCLCTLTKRPFHLPVLEMNVSFELQVSWKIWSLFYRDVYPGMSNMFEKKCLVFGWIFFNSFHLGAWGRGGSKSLCFSSDEFQRGTWERRWPLWRVSGLWMSCV